jgi:hypothetical protein
VWRPATRGRAAVRWPYRQRRGARPGSEVAWHARIARQPCGFGQRQPQARASDRGAGQNGAFMAWARHHGSQTEDGTASGTR